ncbi:MAG: hypothetical protein DRI61_00915 [Chloroflexi bacterium]|nr:MAG: hypothetical protein DRI61_00915 [Chloroflexota bacterium]
MKVKKVFDGWELYPENRKDRQMIRELWNHVHPELQIRRLGKKPKISLHLGSFCCPHFKIKINRIKVFVYSGEDH